MAGVQKFLSQHLIAGNCGNTLNVDQGTNKHIISQGLSEKAQLSTHLGHVAFMGNLEFFFPPQTAVGGVPMPPWIFIHTHVIEAETLHICLLSLSLLVGPCGKREHIETHTCSKLYPPTENIGLKQYRGLQL